MSLDWITAAISAPTPAGPDLWAADDPAYADYYFNALDRLDITYLKPGQIFGGTPQPDELFDSTSINLKSELSSIDALLKTTRDLRLLSLRARWAILAGNLGECAVSVAAIADLLGAMPQDVHPGLADGPADRLEALNDLAQQETMLQPLRYLRLGATNATLRRVMVARGKVTASVDEEDVDLDEMFRDLRSNRDETLADHALLKTMRTDLQRITEAAGQGVKPQFATLITLLNDSLAVLEDAVPDSTAKAGGAQSTPSQSDLASPETPQPSHANDAVLAAQRQSRGEIKTHQEASGRLRAVERYFGASEPSSAALLLVTQARMLLGKSLIEAFEALMPEAATRAAISFSEGSGLRLTHNTLRDLALHGTRPQPPLDLPAVDAPPPAEAEQTPETEPEAPRKRSIDEVLAQFSSDSTPPPAVAQTPQAEIEINHASTASSADIDPALDLLAQKYPVANAQEASAQLQAIIVYFNAMERSSPIPMLLNRARGYIGKDFETLMRELIPKSE